MMRIKSENAEQTEKIAAVIAARLRGGECLALTGDLGVGKTAFTKGLAAALGITENVTSPTFTIVREYEAPLPLFHFDVYRIIDEDELFETGFYDYLTRGGVTVVEWADIIDGALPKDAIRISIERGEADDERLLTITAPAELESALEEYEAACD